MLSSTRGEVSLLLISFSIAVIGLRLQRPVLLIVGLSPLIVAMFWTLSRLAAGLFLGFLSLLYSAPQTGHLFGYDSHSAAKIAQSVQRDGWPVSDLIYAWGFPDTPLIHFHAAMVSTLTGIPVFPRVGPHLLVTSLLPFLYVGVVLVSVYALARSYSPGSRSMLLTAAVLTVGLYLPLYDKKIAFRRHSLALALFSIAILLLFVYNERRDIRYAGLFLLVTFAITATHHLTSVIFAGLLVVYVALNGLSVRRARLSQLRTRKSFALFAMVCGVLWYVIAGYGGELVLLAAQRFVNSVLWTASVSVPNETTGPFVVNWRGFYAPWLYQALPAGSILAGWYLRMRSVETTFWHSFTVIVGVLVAAIGVVSIPFVFVNSFRVFLFYMVVGAWIAPFSLRDLADYFGVSTDAAVRVFVVLLVILSISMIPPYLVADTELNRHNVRSERFDTSLYAASWFISTHGDKSYIVGDTAVREVAEPTTQLQVYTEYPQIRNATVTGDSYVVIREQNRYLYWGKVPTAAGPAYAVFVPNDLEGRFDARQGAIYSSRNVRIYVNESRPSG